MTHAEAHLGDIGVQPLFNKLSRRAELADQHAVWHMVIFTESRRPRQYHVYGCIG